MNLGSLFIESIRKRSQLFNYQTVRWRRPKKPFWLGVAKTKRFIVPTPRIIPTSEEQKAGKALWKAYSTAYKSLMNFIQHDNPRLKDMLYEIDDGNAIKRGPALEKSIEESYKKNEIWNSESARLREQRIKRVTAHQLEMAVKEIDIYEERRVKKLKFIEEIVKKEKDISQTFITPENLDEAIENCLDNVVCYDFAIDLEGNKYHGRESLPREKVVNQEQMIKELFP